tara:strand:- start:969 stop:1211 length:243 start_codon:yes stop_codon:yes gene_type:complete
MIKIFNRNYSTFLKKNNKNEILNLINKIKDCEFYASQYKLINNRELDINYVKHILYIKDKNNNKKKSNLTYSNQLNEWYF